MASDSECRVPQEIAEHIIGFLEGDARSLARCTQVSKSFLPFSQRLLFKKVTLNPPFGVHYMNRPETSKRFFRGEVFINDSSHGHSSQSVERLHSTILSKPHIADYIDELIIIQPPLSCTTVWPENHAVVTFLTIIGAIDAQDQYYMRDIIPLLKQVSRLHIVGSHFPGTVRYMLTEPPCRVTHPEYALRYGCCELKNLTVLHLQNINCIHVHLFDHSPNLHELILDEVGFSQELQPAMVEKLSRELTDRIYLEKFCLYSRSARYKHFTKTYFTSSTTTLNFSRLKSLDFYDDQLSSHTKLANLLNKCQFPLQSFNYSPATHVTYNAYSRQERLPFTLFTRLRYLTIALRWTIKDGSTKNPLEWLNIRLNELSDVNRLESLRLRCIFCWRGRWGIDLTEADALDYHVELAGWMKVDRILASTHKFPKLKRVDVQLASFRREPLLRVDEFSETIHLQVPQLLQRGILHIAEGSAVHNENQD